MRGSPRVVAPILLCLIQSNLQSILLGDRFPLEGIAVLKR